MTITWCQDAGFSENKSMMEARLKRPEYLSLQGNITENWRRCYQRFELYMLAIEADSKPTRTKIAILLGAFGPDALYLMMTTNNVTPNLAMTIVTC